MFQTRMNSNTNGRVIQLDSYTGIFLPPHDWYSDPVNRYSLLVPSSSSNPRTEEDVRYTHSLIFLTHPITSSLLLGLKKRGFGKGTYNGIGGKLNPSETARESIIRETAEEINVDLLSNQISLVGRVKIDVEQGEKVSMAVFVARLTEEQKGQVKESEEIEPHSFGLDEGGETEGLPWELLRPEHHIYLSLLLYGIQRGYQKRKEGWKSRFDLEVKFHPEPKKEDERPDNQRTVKEWRLYVYDSGFS